MTASTRSHFVPTADAPEFVLDAGVSTDSLIAEAGETGAGRVLNRLPFTVPVVSFT